MLPGKHGIRYKIICSKMFLLHTSMYQEWLTTSLEGSNFKSDHLAEDPAWLQTCFWACPHRRVPFMVQSDGEGPEFGWKFSPSSHIGSSVVHSARLHSCASGRPLCYSRRMPQKLCLLLSCRETSPFLSMEISFSCFWCYYAFVNFQVTSKMFFSTVSMNQ